MIDINGAKGEGGGALIRTAVALAASLNIPIHITNIRQRRPQPGLKAQHIAAIKSVAQLSQAEIEGLYLGSREIFFHPHQLTGGKYKVDIGTAGSITLVLQAFLIAASHSTDPVQISIQGGTDVPWAPSVDYLQHITLPLLRSMGYQVKLTLVRRGHYPRGGGLVEIETLPGKLRSLDLLELEFSTIKGISHAVNLPYHVATRQAQAARKILKKAGYDANIQIEHQSNGLGPGSGIVLWTEDKCHVGGSSLGKPGKRAEIVGEEAAKEILYHIKRGSALDRYMGDQIIPYLSLAGNSRIKTAELTQHALSNIWVSEKITGRKFQLKGRLGDVTIIKVN